jgi:hypothetical protein
MKLRAMTLLAAVMIGPVGLAEAADAATLWRGVTVITNRTATAECMANYSIGESFDILYRPNLGAAVPETLQVLGRDGSFLVTSTDIADLTLRTGSMNVTGAVLAKGFSFNNVTNPVTITPAAITPATLGITMVGMLRNAGIAGCNVSFRASLLPVFDGPL